MSTPFRYHVVDVFSREKFQGNPLAVFLDSLSLPATQMQAIAKEMNLSETVFAGPSSKPGCAARLRIFTPNKEMDFAGHPTIGAAFVLLREGLVLGHGDGTFQLEENIGAVQVSVERDPALLLWLTTPPIHLGITLAPQIAAALLGLPSADLLPPAPQILNAGNPTLLIPLRDAATVDRASFSAAEWQRLQPSLPGPMCVLAFAPTAAGAYSRMFAPDYGIAEDPATGSSTGPLAAYMMRHGLAPAAAGSRFLSEQGVRMGRRSVLHIAIDGPSGAAGIRVGGEVTPVFEGRMA